MPHPDQWQELAHLEAKGESICQNQSRALEDEVCVVEQDSTHHRVHLLLRLLLIHQTPLPRVEVLGAHVLDLASGLGVAHHDRDPETQPLHLVEPGVDRWTDPVYHIVEEVHELCDRVGVGFQLHILDEPIECHLPVEFCEGDWVLKACAGRCAGAGAAGWL